MLFETRLSHWGVVTAAELHASGVPDHRRDRWLATGELHRAGRGVYCFGSPPPGDGIWCQQAAVALAGAGPDALLAGPSAARLWQLDGFDSSVAIDVVVPLRCGRRGSNVRRVDVLDGPVVIDGLPTVGIVQTLVELGARAMSGRMRPDEVVEAALESALRRGLFEDASLGDRLGGSRSRRTGPGV